MKAKNDQDEKQLKEGKCFRNTIQKRNILVIFAINITISFI